NLLEGVQRRRKMKCLAAFLLLAFLVALNSAEVSYENVQEGALEDPANKCRLRSKCGGKYRHCVKTGKSFPNISYLCQYKQPCMKCRCNKCGKPVLRVTCPQNFTRCSRFARRSCKVVKGKKKCYRYFACRLCPRVGRKCNKVLKCKRAKLRMPKQKKN
uniref:Uncharacterized protein n=2 Tax=Clytia hemisphaerica TaxID=252671 RepID=A0A7M5XEP9_9CNID